MHWLRKQCDLLGLVVTFGLLLQSLVIPLSTGAHAAALASGLDFASIFCTTRTSTLVPDGTFAPETEKQSKSGSACQACHVACRKGCGPTCGDGFLPTFARVELPGASPYAALAMQTETPAPIAAQTDHARPRDPPRN